jgi:hypothetical protein
METRLMNSAQNRLLYFRLLEWFQQAFSDSRLDKI